MWQEKSQQIMLWNRKINSKCYNSLWDMNTCGFIHVLFDSHWMLKWLRQDENRMIAFLYNIFFRSLYSLSVSRGCAEFETRIFDRFIYLCAGKCLKERNRHYEEMFNVHFFPISPCVSLCEFWNFNSFFFFCVFVLFLQWDLRVESNVKYFDLYSIESSQYLLQSLDVTSHELTCTSFPLRIIAIVVQ
jgi:hypothetical protein